MNRMSWLLMAMALAGCTQENNSAGSGTAADAGVAPKSAAATQDAERDFKEGMALSAYPKVEYRDEQGKPIPFEEFMKQISSGRSFGMMKNSETKEAVVTVNKPGKPVTEVDKSAIRIGSELPELKNVKTLDGKALDNAMFSGHRTLVSFYYSECVPCIAEVPVLNAYAKAHPEMGALAVTFDPAKEARAFVDKHGFEWPVLTDSEAFIDEVGVKTYPTILLIGPDRKIVAKAKTNLLQGRDDTASAVAALDGWVKSQL